MGDVALFVAMFVTMVVLPVCAFAEGTGVAEGYDWTMLGSVAGAAAFTLVVVQYVKAPLDKVWKIPTRVLAYLVALIVMLAAQAFTVGLTPEGIGIVIVNAWLAGSTAIGTYESTFAKSDAKN